MVTLTKLPADLDDPAFRLPRESLDVLLGPDSAGRLFDDRSGAHRIHLETGAEPPAALLPFDQLFEIRARSAIRLWRGMTGRNPGPDPAALSKARRNQLVLALRALDGQLDGATYREIAAALFGADRVPERGWKSHDLRDRTVRLVRFGLGMMRGGYRRLLLHPYRSES